MKKLFATIALVSSMGVAYADQPVALTDGQMDNVSAGFEASTAGAGGHASAFFGAVDVTASSSTQASNSWWYGWGGSTSAEASVDASAHGLLISVGAGASASSVHVW